MIWNSFDWLGIFFVGQEGYYYQEGVEVVGDSLLKIL